MLKEVVCNILDERKMILEVTSKLIIRCINVSSLEIPVEGRSDSTNPGQLVVDPGEVTETRLNKLSVTPAFEVSNQYPVDLCKPTHSRQQGTHGPFRE